MATLGAEETLLFPTSAIFSVSSNSSTGTLAEAGLIGNEGCVGIWSLFDRPSHHVSISLQTTGYALSVSKEFLQQLFLGSPEFRSAVLGYCSFTIKYATQTCFCYRHHSIDQQVVKMILLTMRRTGRTDVKISHQMIATILGVRREGVSTALKRLQSLNLIDQKRCRIQVLLPNSLEREACSCYPIICEYLGYTSVGSTAARSASNDL
jgi:CRP-like cAMP-binding protein